MRLKESVFRVVVLLMFLPLATIAFARDDHDDENRSGHLVSATLWMQTSAEYKAISYQTFNWAKVLLDQRLAKKRGKKPLAIITDLDETVLDNSEYQAFLISSNTSYGPDTWLPWMAAGRAVALPGAVEFFNYAKQKGVEVFYITNRDVKGYEGTKKNLEKLGLPFVDKKHLLLKTDTSNKQPRRDVVTKEYEVVLLLGDTLGDFEEVFVKKETSERSRSVDKLKKQWGRKFIVLPNPGYGDWEGALYAYKWDSAPWERRLLRRSHLKAWDHHGYKKHSHPHHGYDDDDHDD